MITEIGPEHNMAYAIAAQPDGKIIIAGTSDTLQENSIENSLWFRWANANSFAGKKDRFFLQVCKNLIYTKSPSIQAA
ncbi:MAG TPA: hypothetical protein PLU53_15700 [Bacteroidia bacterium]|nr:hypothetical protein [Bacteroidia bacterium]